MLSLYALRKEADVLRGRHEPERIVFGSKRPIIFSSETLSYILKQGEENPRKVNAVNCDSAYNVQLDRGVRYTEVERRDGSKVGGRVLRHRGT